jgi:hypothetical protein
MNAEIRRKQERGTRVLLFTREHPDPSAGFAAAQKRLEEAVARGEELFAQQRDGVIGERAANARKRGLQANEMGISLDHLHRVAVVASGELPELARKFVLPDRNGFKAFRNAAGAIAKAAEAEKELLVRHGLSESVLTTLVQAIGEFDQAVEQAVTARHGHIGARAELETVVQEQAQLVNVLDGIYRLQFTSDAEKLAAWESASTVFGPDRVRPKAPTPPTQPAPGTGQGSSAA